MTDPRQSPLPTPECPQGHGPMVKRTGTLTYEQEWCGEWWDCMPRAAGACCRSSVLIPSPELNSGQAALDV